MSRRALLPFAGVLGAVLGMCTLAPAGSAGAAGAPRLAGALAVARQNSATHALLLHGYAFDRAHPHQPVTIGIRAAGRTLAKFRTDLVRTKTNQRFHLHGPHSFDVTLPFHRKVAQVELVVYGARDARHDRVVSRRSVISTSPAKLITQRAKVYVGRSPYRWGGASPSGFDCSGFAMYVYRRAGMRSLPHNAQAQRDSSRMRRISRGAARPGDLVFYLSGGYAYHVAVYAGRGKQYAATEPGQKIRYQKTPRGVVFGTDWH